MKIIKMDEFRKTPEHTVFLSAQQPYSWSGIQFLGGVTKHNDWWSSYFDTPDNNGSEQLLERWDDMLKNGASYPLETDGYGRNGMFPENPIFMIYEKSDLIALREQIDKAIAACG